jgi:hypothetical protein
VSALPGLRAARGSVESRNGGRGERGDLGCVLTRGRDERRWTDFIEEGGGRRSGLRGWSSSGASPATGRGSLDAVPHRESPGDDVFA